MENKNVKLLTRFLIYISVFLFICFYGISHPKAYIAQDFKWLNRYAFDFPFTTNYEPYTYNAQYFWFNPNDTPNYFIVNACATGGLTFDIRNVSEGDISYVGSINFPDQSCTVSGFTGEKVRYYFKFNSYDILSTSAHISYGVRVENTSNWTVYVNFEDYTFTDTSDFETLTQQQNTTDSIISSSSTNTQDIINNNNTNASAIIDNQNQNTQQQIESQQVCSNLNISNGQGYSNVSGYLNTSGSIVSNSDYKVSDFIPISSGASYSISLNYNASSPAYCLYSNNKVLLSCSNYNNSASVSFVSNNAFYIRYSYSVRYPSYYTTLSGSNCKNGNQAISDDLNNLNDTLTDSSSVEMSNLGDVAGWLPAGPIDSIINLPLTFMNNLYLALNSTCSPLHVPIPYLTNEYIDIPCISTIYQQINGFDTFWNWFGGIASVLILYKYLLALYKYYDDLTTLKANFISDFGGAP